MDRSRANDRTSEDTRQFEARKGDHLLAALDPRVQATEGNGAEFDRVIFIHEALPELDLSEVSIQSSLCSHSRHLSDSPFFVSSMTAGHAAGEALNRRLAKVCAVRGWLMGIGSQRRELFSDGESVAKREWSALRAECDSRDHAADGASIPTLKVMGNIGLSQLIDVGADRACRLIDSLDAVALIVHLNPLQECLQLEGTPHFRGGLSALETLARRAPVPIVVKETGCGISGTTARRLAGTGIRVIDVAGRGGTHWGRVEGLRADRQTGAGSVVTAADTFRDWGLSTVESIRQVVQATAGTGLEVWASGGIRSGLDAAKALRLGASRVGVAQPFLVAAMSSEEELCDQMDRFEFELRIALFCTGAKNLQELRDKPLLARPGNEDR